MSDSSPLASKIVDQLTAWGIQSNAPWIARVLLIVGVILTAMALHFIARKIIVKLLNDLVGRTQSRWDDALAEMKVFERLTHLLPALVLYFGAALALPEESTLYGFVQKLALAYLVLVGTLAASAFLSSLVQMYDVTFPGAKERPILSYIQVAKIFLWVVATSLLVSTLMEKSPWAFLSGLGAMTAILLLIFKDSILGLIASIQLAANDMVRVGDWIELPKFGADGDVVEISLTTVKVQNWDKTISTIPSYHLISDAFKNWRGMSDSGGRRIKRSITLDMNSVRFVDDEMMKRYRKIRFIQAYLDAKLEEIQTWNRDQQVEESSLVDRRKLTNIGTFRAYLLAYLKNHPMIHQEMTLLVRQLAPTEKGLPIEIYVFSKEQRWAEYEAIQADIFDHILAILPEFDLGVVQIPSGTDVRSLKPTPSITPADRS
ncbi:MAG: mechanosensitive ion channel domain-containing protein [Thermoanaerobaculia bacterium]